MYASILKKQHDITKSTFLILTSQGFEINKTLSGKRMSSSTDDMLLRDSEYIQLGMDSLQLFQVIDLHKVVCGLQGVQHETSQVQS